MNQGAKTVGFDCSALMQYAFAKAGVNLPRTSREQAKVGQAINASQAKPGDLIFFDHSGQRPGIDHVALYLGNGKILEAPGTGKTVRISKVNLNSAAAIRRVVSGGTSSAQGVEWRRQRTWRMG